MLPINPDPIIGAGTNLFEDECAEDDWDCNKTTWYSFITDSLQRLAVADYSNFNGDLVTSLLFLVSCIGSWQFLLFMFHKLNRGKKGCKSGLSQLASQCRGSNPESENATETATNAAETDEQRDTADVRAAGDSWEQDEYDPDYDANNEIMVMLLQGSHDDSDDVTPGRSEAEEDGLLEELTRPEDEVQVIEIQNEANDTLDLQAANQEEDSSNTAPKEENTKA